MQVVTETVIKLQQELQAKYGESIPDVVPDGQIKRFPKSPIWVVGNVWQFKGKDYCLFIYGNWKFGGTHHRVDSFDKKEFKNKTFTKNFTAKMAEINERVASEKKEKNENCKKKWMPLFKNTDKEQLHDYLIDKGIEKTYGTGVDSQGVLMVPIYDVNGFVGVQRIFKNPETNLYEKRFSAGIKIKGSLNPLIPFKDSDLVYVSEGFATACSIQEAFPDIPSICCFNANNILPAIESIRLINPTCKIIIAADRDPESNTGEKYARYATKKISSCIYKMPKFENDNGKWTDFNDLHQFNSIDAVKDQLKYNESQFVIIQPLGVLGEKFFYMSSINTQEISISGHNHKESYFYNLVPDRDWWMKKYPKFDRDDENKENPTGVNWVNAGNDLMKSCIAVGRYNPSNVRSSGVWEDNGVYYYHNGHKLYDGKHEVDIFSEKLTKNYVMGNSCHEIKRSLQLNYEERAALVEIFGTLSTSSRQQGLLLLGWLATSSIAGALPWRPHVWITGQSSQGKSWTMEEIIAPILRGFCLRPQGASSEAGIRQFVGNQSLPVVFDEFETDNERSSEKNEAVIILARQSSTPTEGVILKGTTGGSAMSFSPNFSMCVSSINHNLLHKQDKNRWTLIEFSSERAGKEQFKRIKDLVKIGVKPETGKKLVSYVFHHIDVYFSNYRTIEEHLSNKGYKGHFCRQYASLIAGLLLIIQDEPIEEASLEAYLENFNFEHYLEKTGDEDSEIFKEYLLGSMVRVGNENMTLRTIVNNTNLTQKDCLFQRTLMEYGMKADEHNLYVKRKTNKNFRSFFEHSKWRNNWEESIMRIEGSDNNDNKTVWINGESVKVARIPFRRY